MDMPRVRSATADERQAVISSMTLAFTADPFNRWYLADADRYLRYFPQIVDGILGPALDAGTCYVTDGLEGVAIWLAPGAAPDEEKLAELFAAAPPAHLATELGNLLAAFENYHPHDDDCWYLPLIGVDPAHQGKGLGAALMKHATDMIDAQGALSYLESSSPRNLPLYERHGFERMGDLPFGDAGGVATPMLRTRR